MRIPPQVLFSAVSNWFSTCQFPSLGNDRDANTIAKLLIPNTLLIRQAALLEVAERMGDGCGNANSRAHTLIPMDLWIMRNVLLFSKPHNSKLSH